MTIHSDSAAKSFASVDASGEAEFFSQYLDRVRSLPSMIAVEAEILRLVAEVGPLVVLDVGCGTGDFLAELVTTVGPAATAVGIEKSVLLTQLARERHRSASTLSFVVHDFEGDDPPPQVKEFGNWNACADVIILNRVLQHLVDPLRLLGNLRSVMKAGGRIIVADVDWGQAKINGPDDKIARAILAEHVRVMINPGAGANLPQELISAGFANATPTLTITHQFEDLDVADMIFSFSRAAHRLIARGTIQPTVFQNWMEECRELAALGRFRTCLFQTVSVATA
jgi:SAM-dependent methyltransferase